MNLKTRRLLFCTCFLALTVPLFAQTHDTTARSTDRIQKEVRHELAMLPYVTVFDNVMFRVDGSTVTLMGQVTNPTLKADMGRAVKNVEGVEQVNNQVEVLPGSPMDDQLRIQLFHAIYGYAPLEKYSMGVNKSIRIIVNMGHVTLEGVVDSQGDKDMANVRANTVPGIFSVTNNLQVSK
jgi:hyperosmotically inducible protein